MNPEINAKVRTQIEYCLDKALPCFIPMDGVCFACNKQIFDAISLETASKTLITGCPYIKCSRSFVD